MTAPKISEAAVLNPLTPYGSTKAAGEMLMSAFTASYGLRCACIRLTNVYGPGMQAKDSIVARLMRAIRFGSTFEIYGDGNQVRDYVHVTDVVAAMRLGLLSSEWAGPMVIGSGTSLSVHEVVDAVRQVSGAELPVRHGPAKPGEMPAVIVDPAARTPPAGRRASRPWTRGSIGVWDEWSGPRCRCRRRHDDDRQVAARRGCAPRGRGTRAPRRRSWPHPAGRARHWRS